MARWATSLGLAALFAAAGGRAAFLTFDNFTAEPEESVTIAADNLSATISESEVNPVILVNDPGHPLTPDPEIIVAGAGITLSFDWVFTEGAGEDDEFGVFIVDEDGKSAGEAYEFFTSETGAGTVVWDLSGLTDQASIGLQFQLGSRLLELGRTSTVEVSNLQLGTHQLDVQSTPFTDVAITGSHPGTTQYLRRLDPAEAVSLTAPAGAADGDTDYQFVHWTVAGEPQTDGEATVAFSITEATVVEAVYEVVPRTLSVSSTPETGAGITGSSPGTTDYQDTVDDNSTVTLTAPIAYVINETDLEFVHWSLNDVDQPDGELTVSFAIQADTNAVAVYQPIPRELTVTSPPFEGLAITGTLNGNTPLTETLDDNSEVTLTATATAADGDTDYEFVHWTLNGVDQTADQTTLVFNINQVSTAAAVYQVIPRSLQVNSTPLAGLDITGTPAGTTDYGDTRDDNSQVSLTAPAIFADGETDYRFLHWTLNSVAQAAGELQLTFLINEDTTAVAAYEIVPRDIAVSSTPITGIGITGSAPGTTDYQTTADDNSTVDLVAPATAADGDDDYEFVRWSLEAVAQTDGEASLSFTINQNSSAEAEYRLIPRSLTVTSSPVSGIDISGTPAGTTEYASSRDDNTVVDLEAPAAVANGDDDYQFVRWVLNGADQAADVRTLTFNINEDSTADAVYELVPRTLTVNSSPLTGVVITGTDGGTTDYAAEIGDNLEVTLTAPATAADGDSDFQFVRWVLGGVNQVDDQRDLTFNINADLTVEAVYEPVPRDLSVSSTPVTGIAIIGVPAGTTDYGSVRDDNSEVDLEAPELFADDENDYQFVRWVLDGVDQAALQRTLVFAINDTATAEAVYELVPRTLTVSASPLTIVAIGGTDPGTTGYAAEVGDNLEVTLTAPAAAADGDTDYEFVRWVLGGVEQADGVLDLIFNINADVSAEAVYDEVQRDLTVSSSPLTGVAITGTPAGTTDYGDARDDNSTVTLTAPAAAADGDSDYRFVRWRLNQADQTLAEQELAFAINEDSSAEAVYELVPRQLTVTTSPLTGIEITGSHPGTSNYGAEVGDNLEVTLTAPASAADGLSDFQFVRWVLGGVDQGDGELDLVFNINADVTAEAVYEPVPRNLAVSSSPITGIAITGVPSGTTDYSDDRDDNSQVSLTAPDLVADGDSDYQFVRWDLNGSAQPDDQHDLTFDINAATGAEAVYELVPRQLTVTSNPITGVAISGSDPGTTDYGAEVGDNLEVSLTAPETFADGETDYTFVRWILDGVDQPDTQLDLVFNINDDITAEVLYDRTPRDLNVTSTGLSGVAITGSSPGTTAYSDVLDDNSTVTLNAPAAAADGASDFEFVRWVLDGIDQPDDQLALSFAINATADAEAVYAHVQRQLTVDSQPFTGIAVSGPPTGQTRYVVSVNDNETVSLTTPAVLHDGATDFAFVKWVLDSVDQPAGVNTLSFAINADAEAIAVYEQIPRELMVSSSPPTGVDIAGTDPGTTDYTTSVLDNELVTLTAPLAAADGATDYEFVHWLIDETPQTDGAATISFKINAPTAVAAIYAIVQHQLQVVSTPVAGIAISGTPSGTTAYVTTVDDNTEVTLEGQAVWSDGDADFTFVRWLLDGVEQPDDQTTLTFTIQDDAVATAVYAAVPRQLSVESTPVTGVAISGSSPGTTDYGATLDDDALVTLSAPSRFVDTETYEFVRWTVGGVDQPVGQLDLNFRINADVTVAATYKVFLPDIQVTSTPVAGVVISGTPSGTTDFTEEVALDSQVTLTAPETFSADGRDYTFDRWIIDGVDEPSGQLTVMVTASEDITAEAHYLLLAQLTLEPGWNLVTVPVWLANTDIDTVLGSQQLGLVWYWDDGDYRAATDFEPGRAYWVFFPGDSQLVIELQGNWTDLTVSGAAGWNLVGAIDTVPVEVPPEVVGVPWGWDALQQSLYLIDNASLPVEVRGLLSPFNGFWLYLSQPAVLVLGNE